MRKRKSIFDDGFHEYLIKDATFVGTAGIPMLMNLNNVQIPKDILPFTKAKSCTNKRQYVHFYLHDREFSRVFQPPTGILICLSFTTEP